MTAATTGADVRRRSLFSWKRLLFTVLGLLTAVTIYEHEVPLLDPAHPNWAHVAPFRWWLAPHVAAAAVALIVGPLQFSDTLRRRSLALHRWLGRTYLGAVLIAGALAVYIGVAFEIPENRWLMGTMAGLWLLATALAWLAIRNRRIDQHKLWMMRSYALTFTFVTTRFIPDLVLPGMGYAGITALYWSLIVASMLLPDLILNGRALWRR